MEIKGIIRVPTKTQYAFIEAHVEGTAQQLVEAYNELNEAYWGQGKKQWPAGHEDKEWRQILDRYYVGKAMTAEEMEGMNEFQSYFIKTYDNMEARAKRREETNNE